MSRNNSILSLHDIPVSQIKVKNNKILAEFSNYFSWIYIFIGCYLVLSFCNGKTSDRDFNK